MAVIEPKFLNYVVTVLRLSLNSEVLPFDFDPMLQLAEHCVGMEDRNRFQKAEFSEDVIALAKAQFAKSGIVGAVNAYFGKSILKKVVPEEVERKLLALKRCYSSLPSTKASTIVKGFGHKVGSDEVLAVYASYGLVRSMKDLVEAFDFVDVNRRVRWLSVLLNQEASEDAQKVHRRYLGMRSYVMAERKEREKVILGSGVKRSMFFHHWKSFKKYGLLGLVDCGKEVFRETKVGLANEAWMVVDKLQHHDRGEAYYVERMEHKGAKIDRTAVSRIFSRWGVKNYQSVFISDLERLKESVLEEEAEAPCSPDVLPEIKVERRVDANILPVLEGMATNGMMVAAPGLLVLWAYLEELGIFSRLESMGLTGGERGYSWFEHLLLNVGRIFYGIPSYGRTCDHEEPTLPLFTLLVAMPGDDTFLNGLGGITQQQVFQLQQWLIIRAKELGLASGRRVAFDFHHIDLDVEMERLRQFGRGPSPKKKVCYSGFRPHIAWDLDTGSLLVAEFRKASARGTTTIKRFVIDFLMAPFKGLFHEIYMDSEYTGKDVWSFTMAESGMGANLTACLKQNAMVRKARDSFLLLNRNTEGFWLYYDDNHVYGNGTFTLEWEYDCPQTNKKQMLLLNCAVKKNIHNGKLRCFGTSKKEVSSKDILDDYSHRWAVENAIKDLVHSYFLDNCPGTDPHHVNVHFLNIALCRLIYRMIQRDLGDFLKNHDGSFKTLRTMRETLFRPSSARILFRNETFEIHFLNSFSPKLTKALRLWFETIQSRWPSGLSIIGGLKLKYFIQSPHGEEHRNALRKKVLSEVKKFPPPQKIG